ncbi:hypothetical protein IC575_028909 [Cucumis melo]
MLLTKPFSFSISFSFLLATFISNFEDSLSLMFLATMRFSLDGKGSLITILLFSLSFSSRTAEFLMK